MPRILFGVSSIGLGHVRRSLAVANELRRIARDVEIEWICAEPAITFLRQKSEKILDVSSKMQSLSVPMESNAKYGRIDDMGQIARRTLNIAKQNYFLIKPNLSRYDVIVQDEFIETNFSFLYDKHQSLPERRAVITDYISFRTASPNPINRFTIWLANRYARRSWLRSSVRIFADELESLPERDRGWTMRNFQVVGPVCSDLPQESKDQLRARLLPDSAERKLIVFTVGGTSLGKYLADFVLSDHEALSSELDANILILAGPRIEEIASTRGKAWPKVVGFTPNAIEYFKAADCVVAQAGGSTLNEVSALGTPCVSIPILDHFEQQANARRFQKKFGFPVLQYDQLNHRNLVEAVRESLQLKYTPSGSSEGARKAAETISRAFLSSIQ
ncbi:MAG: hypothetical protein JRN20_19970 [Nitrososphaerota archaeon]|nr:hypothetical protein [Nitrososphaerota archaeon]